MELHWLITYVGASYLMVGGVVMHAALVAYMNLLVREGRVLEVVADLVKVVNFFLFFVFIAYVQGAIFDLAKLSQVHNSLYSIIFAASGCVLLILYIFIMGKLSKLPVTK